MKLNLVEPDWTVSGILCGGSMSLRFIGSEVESVSVLRDAMFDKRKHKIGEYLIRKRLVK